MLRHRNMLTIVWCRFGSWGLVIKSNFYPEFQTLSTRFGQDFEVEAQARFWSWSLVSILLLIFGWGSEDYSSSRFWGYVWSRFWSLSLVEMLIFGWGFEVAAWSGLWKWNLIKICLRTCDMTYRSYFGDQNSTLGSVVPLAMFFFCFYRHLAENLSNMGKCVSLIKFPR